MNKPLSLLVDMSTNKEIKINLSPLSFSENPHPKANLFLWLTYSYFVSILQQFFPCQNKQPHLILKFS